MSATQTNPFLAGNFAPVREETQIADLRIIGELPRDMNDIFLRIGPNPQFEPIGTYHWFDGDGMLHGVRIPLFEGFQKYDHERGMIESHLHGKSRYGGEGVFVPRDGATTEDDGWVVTYVHDEINDTAEMVVVSAQDITAKPVARVLIPARVPYGFHGTWVPGEHIGA